LIAGIENNEQGQATAQLEGKMYYCNKCGQEMLDSGHRCAVQSERLTSVVRSNATLKKYLSLCNEFGFKPASIGSGDDVKDIIQQSWSMADEFVRKLTELLKS
jgi:hypothetical protein